MSTAFDYYPAGLLACEDLHPADVARVLRGYIGTDISDLDSGFLLELRDGRFAYLHVSCGHDYWGEAQFFANVEAAASHYEAQKSETEQSYEHPFETVNEDGLAQCNQWHAAGCPECAA
jgi:hypothetical protein